MTLKLCRIAINYIRQQTIFENEAEFKVYLILQSSVHLQLLAAKNFGIAEHKVLLD